MSSQRKTRYFKRYQDQHRYWRKPLPPDWQQPSTTPKVKAGHVLREAIAHDAACASWRAGKCNCVGVLDATKGVR